MVLGSGLGNKGLGFQVWGSGLEDKDSEDKGSGLENKGFVWVRGSGLV